MNVGCVGCVGNVMAGSTPQSPDARQRNPIHTRSSPRHWRQSPGCPGLLRQFCVRPSPFYVALNVTRSETIGNAVRADSCVFCGRLRITDARVVGVVNREEMAPGCARSSLGNSPLAGPAGMRPRETARSRSWNSSRHFEDRLRTRSSPRCLATGAIPQRRAHASGTADGRGLPSAAPDRTEGRVVAAALVHRVSGSRSSDRRRARAPGSRGSRWAARSSRRRRAKAPRSRCAARNRGTAPRG